MPCSWFLYYSIIAGCPEAYMQVSDEKNTSVLETDESEGSRD
jgi:hypothetical protein